MDQWKGKFRWLLSKFFQQPFFFKLEGNLVCSIAKRPAETRAKKRTSGHYFHEVERFTTVHQDLE